MKERDRKVLEYVAAHLDDHGYPPSVREVADHLGVSRGTAQNALRRMMDEGLLKRPPGVPRGLRISEAAMKSLREEM